LRVAWKELANHCFTPFERREARDQIERCGVELQRHLKLMEAERSRYRKRSLEENTVAALANRSFGFSPAAYRAGLGRPDGPRQEIHRLRVGRRKKSAQITSQNRLDVR